MFFLCVGSASTEVSPSCLVGSVRCVKGTGGGEEGGRGPPIIRGVGVFVLLGGSGRARDPTRPTKQTNNNINNNLLSDNYSNNSNK